jgi:hypothetical protein
MSKWTRDNVETYARERYVDAVTEMQDDDLLDALQQATVSNSYGSHDDQIVILRSEILGRMNAWNAR